MTGANGECKMKRRAAGQLPDGRNYGLVFAEHVSRPLVGAEIWVGNQATGLTVALATPVTLVGWVVDQAGIPVAEARIRITGFKTSSDSGSGAVARAEYPVPVPLDRLIPPVYSGAKGTFAIDGLPAGLRYVLTSEKAEYRVVLKEDVAGFRGINSVTFGCSNNLSTSQLSNLFVNIDWLRGNSENGSSFRWEEFKGRTVVFHFGSAYGEASLRAQYPEGGSGLSRLIELYGDAGTMCVWVLPEGEGKGDVAQMALALYPDLPVGVFRREGIQDSESGIQNRDRTLDRSEFRGNVVMGRDGRILAICSDQQVFSAAKKAME